MIHKKHVYPLVQRNEYCLIFSKDFDVFILKESGHPFCFPRCLYCGERIIYLTPGVDNYSGGGWRGNLSDSWPCIDFRFDFNKALTWLKSSEDSVHHTLFLWTKKLIKS